MDDSTRIAAESSGPIGPLDWIALLALWVDFSKAALVLPARDQGDRWRDSVVAIITLQAVTLALGEIGALALSERALALDRAEILINQHTIELEALWAVDLPAELRLLLNDARRSLASAESAVVAQPNGPVEADD